MYVLPTTLPVALDSYRFSGGGPTEDTHVVFSDSYILNDDESKNIFTFTKVKNDQTYVRFYIEDYKIKLELVCTDPDSK